MQALSEPTRSAVTDAEAESSARRALAAVPDRAQREAAAALARVAYGRILKETRERKGIRLATIAAATKVNESLFVSLERGDVSRWPIGIYRRSFFRAYVTSVGMPVDASLDEFLRLFPDESEASQPLPATQGPPPLRLGLAASPRFQLSRVHLMAAFIDLSVLLLVASVLMWLTQARAATVLAATTLTYYVVATAIVGSSAGAWWQRTRGARKRFKGLRLAR